MKPLRTLALIAAAALAAAGCSKKDTAEATLQDPTPELVGQGSHDLAFAVTDYVHHADGTQSVRARARHQGATVEMRIALDGDWKEQDLGGGQRGFKGQLQIERVNDASDALMRAIDAVYETKAGAGRLSKTTPFTGVSLEGTPQALNTGPTRIKLMYEGGSGLDYCELLLYVDFSKTRIELREKDPQYRAKVVKVLSEPR